MASQAVLIFIFAYDQFVCLHTMFLEAGLLCVASGEKKEVAGGKMCGFRSVR